MKKDEDNFSSGVKTNAAIIEVKWRDIVQGKCIGSGATSSVFAGTWKENEEVAIKVFRGEMKGSLTKSQKFKQELEKLSKLRHSHVLRLIGVCDDVPVNVEHGTGNMALVTELMLSSLESIIYVEDDVGAENYDALRHFRPVEYIDKVRIARDIAFGMRYLHKVRLIHKDLKPGNVLIDHEGRAKISDFGTAQFLSMGTGGTRTHLDLGQQGGREATWRYAAPEVHRSEAITKSADVYSFGVILWELVTLTHPWEQMSNDDIYRAVGLNRRTLEIPEDFDKPMAALIQACFAQYGRPTFVELFDELDVMYKNADREKSTAVNAERIAKDERIEELEREKECSVCLASPRTVLFLPCRHSCCCFDCGMSAALTKCTICREPIANKVEIFR